MKTGTLKVDGICADVLREQELKIRQEERGRAVRIMEANKGNPGAAMAEILDEGVE